MPPRARMIAALPVSLALAHLAGCSSKNPDALAATNVDENLAIAADMNAAMMNVADESATSADAGDSNHSNSEELAGAGTTQANVADANAEPARESSAASNAAVDAAAAILEEASQLDEQVHAAEDEFNEESDADNDSEEDQPQIER
jgi:hypothetical protein